MIDQDGFRPNVGIIITNDRSNVFWARRVGGDDAWQFPQGGIKKSETPEIAMYRELEEEVGLQPEDVKVLASTKDWLHYRLPKRYIRHHKKPVCIGQKQIWFVLKLISDEQQVNLCLGGNPEFDLWRWVDYWHPLEKIVDFKKDVYRSAMTELAPFVLPNQDSPPLQTKNSNRA